jgi:hypothetical protein
VVSFIAWGNNLQSLVLQFWQSTAVSVYWSNFLSNQTCPAIGRIHDCGWKLCALPMQASLLRAIVASSWANQLSNNIDYSIDRWFRCISDKALRPRQLGRPCITVSQITLLDQELLHDLYSLGHNQYHYRCYSRTPTVTSCSSTGDYNCASS